MVIRRLVPGLIAGVHETGLRDRARRQIAVHPEGWGGLEEAFPPQTQTPPATRRREREAERNPRVSVVGQAASLVRGDGHRDVPRKPDLSPLKPRASDLFHAREHGEQLVDTGGQQVQRISKQGDQGLYLHLKEGSPQRITPSPEKIDLKAASPPGPSPEQLEAFRQHEIRAAREKCLHTALLKWRTYVEMCHKRILPRTPPDELYSEHMAHLEKAHAAIEASEAAAQHVKASLAGYASSDMYTGRKPDMHNTEQVYARSQDSKADERTLPPPEPDLEDEWSWLGERSRDVARVLRVHGNPQIALDERREQDPADIRILHLMAVKIQAAARGMNDRARANALRCDRKKIASYMLNKDAEIGAKDTDGRSEHSHLHGISETASFFQVLSPKPDRDHIVQGWLAGDQVTAERRASETPTASIPVHEALPASSFGATSDAPKALGPVEVAKSDADQGQVLTATLERDTILPGWVTGKNKVSDNREISAKEADMSQTERYQDVPFQFVAIAQDDAGNDAPRSMYSSAASGDHLSERVSDIPGDQVSNASNATISGADTRWVDMVSVADSQTSDITECSVSDAQPSRHLPGASRWVAANSEQLKKSKALASTSRWVPPAGGSPGNASRSVDFDSPEHALYESRPNLQDPSLLALAKSPSELRSQAMEMELHSIHMAFEVESRLFGSTSDEFEEELHGDSHKIFLPFDYADNPTGMLDDSEDSPVDLSSYNGRVEQDTHGGTLDGIPDTHTLDNFGSDWSVQVSGSMPEYLIKEQTDADKTSPLHSTTRVQDILHSAAVLASSLVKEPSPLPTLTKSKLPLDPAWLAAHARGQREHKEAQTETQQPPHTQDDNDSMLLQPPSPPRPAVEIDTFSISTAYTFSISTASSRAEAPTNNASLGSMAVGLDFTKPKGGLANNAYVPRESHIVQTSHGNKRGGSESLGSMAGGTEEISARGGDKLKAPDFTKSKAPFGIRAPAPTRHARLPGQSHTFQIGHGNRRGGAESLEPMTSGLDFTKTKGGLGKNSVPMRERDEARERSNTMHSVSFNASPPLTMQHAPKPKSSYVAAPPPVQKSPPLPAPSPPNPVPHANAIPRTMTLAPNKLKLALAPISSEREKASSVPMTLKLAVDFQLTAGKMGSQLREVFMKDLQHDLARASGWDVGLSQGAPPENFQIKMVAPGSVIVDVDILRESSEGRADPWSVAAVIFQQQSDPNSTLLSGILTKHLTSLSVNSFTDGQWVDQVKYASMPDRKPSSLSGNNVQDGKRDNVQRAAEDNNLAAIFTNPVKIVGGGQGPLLQEGGTSNSQSPRQQELHVAEKEASDKASRLERLEVKPNLATTVMGDWTDGGESMSVSSSPNKSMTIMGDFGENSPEISPPSEHHQPRPPTPPKWRQRPPTPPRSSLSLGELTSAVKMLGGSPSVLPEPITSQSDYSLDKSGSRSSSNSPQRESIIMSAEMVYFDENSGVVPAQQRRASKKITFYTTDDAQPSVIQAPRESSSNPSATSKRAQSLTEYADNFNPVTVMGDWDFMGTILSGNLDLSGMSDSSLGQPPLRALPDVPKSKEPPQKPLPGITLFQAELSQADLKTSTHPVGTDGALPVSEGPGMLDAYPGYALSHDKDTHRLMTLRINTEAVATMRGVNTLLAVLQARNDAAEIKLRSQANIIAQRDGRIEVLMRQVEDLQKLQEKYTSDLGQITVDADRESNGLRREKRFLQDEINKLEGRLKLLITGNQEQNNEINRLRLQIRDLTLEKAEHEIEIDRLQMQLRGLLLAPPLERLTPATISKAGERVLGGGGRRGRGGRERYADPDLAESARQSHAEAWEGGGGADTVPAPRRRHESEISAKLPSFFKKMTELQVADLGFDELRKNDDAMRTISDSSAKASTSENMRPPLQYPPDDGSPEIQEQLHVPSDDEEGQGLWCDIGGGMQRTGGLPSIPAWDDISRVMMIHVDNLLAAKYRIQKRIMHEWLGAVTVEGHRYRQITDMCLGKFASRCTARRALAAWQLVYVRQCHYLVISIRANLALMRHCFASLRTRARQKCLKHEFNAHLEHHFLRYRTPPERNAWNTWLSFLRQRRIQQAAERETEMGTFQNGGGSRASPAENERVDGVGSSQSGSDDEDERAGGSWSDDEKPAQEKDKEEEEKDTKEATPKKAKKDPIEPMRGKRLGLLHTPNESEISDSSDD